MPRWKFVLILLIAVFVLGPVIYVGKQMLSPSDAPGRKGDETQPVPVEVAAIRRGTLSLDRTFSGTIDPQAQFRVAAKVGGRIQHLYADVADPVERGQVVAQLDDAEFRQAMNEAAARRAVAEANLAESRSRLEIAQRELDRNRTLHERGIASESILDSVRAEFLASEAAVKVAEANLQREDAALAAARIRLGYTTIQADWEQGDEERTVAERYVEEGDTIAANSPLFSIIELDPVRAVIQVTEKDYPRIILGQPATLLTDAFPGKIFTGVVSQISPVFKQSSRQATIEVEVANPAYLLKPGMFARCTLELERVEDVVYVPEMAITRRHDQTGVFQVDEQGKSVHWVTVKPGLQDNELVELVGTDLTGRVVTLGQQFIEDGSSIRIAGQQETSPQGAESL